MPTNQSKKQNSVWLKVGAGLTVATIIVAGVYFWDRIRETISEWLRENGYKESDLMKAWIQLNNLVTPIRYHLFIRVKQHPSPILVSEHKLLPDELATPEFLSMVDKRDKFKILIMSNVN